MHGYYNSNFLIVSLFLYFLLTMIVATDANRRGLNGTLWALAVLLMPMMRIFIYLIYMAVTENRLISINQSNYPVSKNEYAEIFCTSCGKQNLETVSFCKYCGAKIN